MPNLDLATIKLVRGAHQSLEEGACLLEIVSHLAGEPWGDHPECASPVLAAFGRRFNDRLNDEDRQRLLAFAPRLIGTRGSRELDERRSMLAVDWLIRTSLPRWLDLANEPQHAKALRALPEIKTPTDAAAASPLVYAARNATWPKREAFRKIVRDAVKKALAKKGAEAEVVAEVVAGVVAGAGAGVVAGVVAGAGAAVVAEVVAEVGRKLTWGEAYDIAYKAASKAFDEKLQSAPLAAASKQGTDEAFDLFDRMIVLQ